MRTKIITAVASNTQTVIAESAYQYDWGLRLEVTGLELPDVTEWQFSNNMSGKAAETTLGDSTGVDIPNDLLISGEHVYAWLFLHSTVNDGYTVYTFDIPVIQRTRPVEEEPTPEQAGLISQAVAALNAAVEQTGLDVIATGEDAAAAAESARQAGLSEESAYASAQAAAGSVGEISDYATAAYNSKVAAQTAQGKAEDAQTAAETAQGKAEGARDLALEAKADAIEAKNTAVSKAGEASQSATDASGYATTASNKATEASTNALKAEGYAVGKQNGSDVSSGTYYHNNAKYYADNASGSATTATTKAGEAGNSALQAEGYAVGKQNGTDVASGSPYYHNNSKYYAAQAQAVAESIPADYTTLSNDVTQLKSDLNDLKMIDGSYQAVTLPTAVSGKYLYATKSATDQYNGTAQNSATSAYVKVSVNAKERYMINGFCRLYAPIVLFYSGTSASHANYISALGLVTANTTIDKLIFDIPEGVVMIGINIMAPDEHPVSLLKLTPTKTVDYLYDLNVNSFGKGNPVEWIGSAVSVFDNILCIGDSITQGGANEPSVTPDASHATRTVTDAMYNYPNTIKKLYGCDTTIKGTSGYTSSQWLTYYGDDDLTGHDCAVIFLGNNDHRFVSEGGMTPADAIALNKTNLESIIALVRAQNYGIPIFICTLLDGWNDANGVSGGVCVNAKTLAEENADVFLIDLRKYSSMKYNSAYMYTHPTAIGYQKLGQEIASAISYWIDNEPDKFRWVRFVGTRYAVAITNPES